MNTSKILLNSSVCNNVSRVVSRSIFTSSTTSALRSGYSLGLTAPRHFSTSRRSQIEFFPPPKETDKIRETRPAWKHYETTEEQLNNIQIDHRQTRSWSDAWALNVVKLLRWGTDIATGYRHDESKPYVMSEKKWLVRFIFLETVAGVPGMTAGMLRHFRSLRRMQRDNGWMETLLEDAYNERMHLLTFMKMAEPGWFMKFLILGAQGVFANGFFLSYILAPKMCHRFVGYLEEEAVRTYTYAIEDLDKGRLPGWEKLQAPEIAVTYWNMPEGKRTMRDLLLYVRADEAKHREIHHTLGNLDQNKDPNPFVSQYKDDAKPHPEHGFKNLRSQGWEREDVI